MEKENMDFIRLSKHLCQYKHKKLSYIEIFQRYEMVWRFREKDK